MPAALDMLPFFGQQRCLEACLYLTPLQETQEILLRCPDGWLESEVEQVGSAVISHPSTPDLHGSGIINHAIIINHHTVTFQSPFDGHQPTTDITAHQRRVALQGVAPTSSSPSLEVKYIPSLDPHAIDFGWHHTTRTTIDNSFGATTVENLDASAAR